MRFRRIDLFPFKIFNRCDYTVVEEMQILDVDQSSQSASPSAPSRNKNRNQVLHTSLLVDMFVCMLLQIHIYFVM